MAGRRTREESAEGAPVGTLLLIVAVLATTVGAFTWMSYEEQAPAPHALTLTTTSAPAGPDATELTLAGVGGSVQWQQLALALDGAAGGYSIQVRGGDLNATSVDAPWSGAMVTSARLVSPGDIIRVALAAPGQGATLLVEDRAANAVLAKLPVRVG